MQSASMKLVTMIRKEEVSKDKENFVKLTAFADILVTCKFTKLANIHLHVLLTESHF